MKLPFFATLFTFMGVVVLCLLGSWQIQRLQWKQGILDNIAAEMEVDAASRFIDLQFVPDDMLFMRGHVTGRFDHDKEFFLQSRTHDGVPGYHLIAPLLVDDKTTLLVNRGWVPIELERKEGFSIFRPQGTVTLVGMLTALPEYNAFVPENDLENSTWYKIDIREISEHFLIDTLSDGLFYVDGEEIVGQYPVPAAQILSPSNNHAQYAVFWFTMAAAFVFVYFFRFIAPQLKNA